MNSVYSTLNKKKQYEMIYANICKSRVCSRNSLRTLRFGLKCLLYLRDYDGCFNMYFIEEKMSHSWTSVIISRFDFVADLLATPIFDEERIDFRHWISHA